MVLFDRGQVADNIDGDAPEEFFVGANRAVLDAELVKFCAYQLVDVICWDFG